MLWNISNFVLVFGLKNRQGFLDLRHPLVQVAVRSNLVSKQVRLFLQLTFVLSFQNGLGALLVQFKHVDEFLVCQSNFPLFFLKLLFELNLLLALQKFKSNLFLCLRVVLFPGGNSVFPVITQFGSLRGSSGQNLQLPPFYNLTGRRSWCHDFALKDQTCLLVSRLWRRARSFVQDSLRVLQHKQRRGIFLTTDHVAPLKPSLCNRDRLHSNGQLLNSQITPFSLIRIVVFVLVVLIVLSKQVSLGVNLAAVALPIVHVDLLLEGFLVQLFFRLELLVV